MKQQEIAMVSPRTHLTKADFYLLATIIVCFVGFHSATLTRAPVFWTDEAVCMTAAANMTLENLGPIMGHLRADGSPLELGNYPPLYFATQRAVMELTGVDLWRSRMVNLLLAAGSIVLLAGFCREVGLGRVGTFFAALWLIAHNGFIRAARSGRPDMLCFFFASASFLAYAKFRNANQKGRAWWGLGAPSRRARPGCFSVLPRNTLTPSPSPDSRRPPAAHCVTPLRPPSGVVPGGRAAGKMTIGVYNSNWRGQRRGFAGRATDLGGISHVGRTATTTVSGTARA